MRVFRFLSVLVVVGFVSLSMAYAQLSRADGAVRKACQSALQAPLPDEIGSLPAPERYARCNSYGLYGSRHFGQARSCAIQERAGLIARLVDSPAAPYEQDDEGNYVADVSGRLTEDGEPLPAGGLIVLAELYANGEGVQRSPELAARFFCEAVDTNEVESDASETWDILAMLDRLLHPTAAAITFCPQDSRPGATVGVPLTRACEQMEEETD